MYIYNSTMNSVETTYVTNSKNNKFIQHIPGRIHEVHDILTKDECLQLIQKLKKVGLILLLHQVVVMVKLNEPVLEQVNFMSKTSQN